MKKGQSAVEYLVTHGWAILVLFLVITILYSLGVFNPSRFVAEECVFQPGFGCADVPRLHKASASGPLAGYSYVFGTEFTNGLGYDIAITKLKITSTNLITSDQYTCELDTTTSTNPSSDCATLLLLSWDDATGSYDVIYPQLLINGEKQRFNLLLKTPPGEAPGSARIGDVRELGFTLTYRNCNTGAWNRGTHGPYALDWDDRFNPEYQSCITASSSEHTLSGKIVLRVGREINTATVYG